MKFGISFIVISRFILINFQTNPMIIVNFFTFVHELLDSPSYKTILYHFRPNYSIYAIFVIIMARPPQLHKNETFFKLIFFYLHAYHQRFDLKIVIFTARKLAAYCIHVFRFKLHSNSIGKIAFRCSFINVLRNTVFASTRIRLSIRLFSSYLVFQIAISKVVFLGGCPGWSLLRCDQTSKLFFFFVVAWQISLYT